MIELELCYENVNRIKGLITKYRAISRHISNRLKITKEYQACVILVDESMIQDINKNYRKIDKVTDVISFAFLDNSDFQNADSIMLGDIYICYPKAVLQAQEYNHSLERELCFLFTHGLLHLLGYDHQNQSDEKEMDDLQKDILAQLNINR